MRPLDGATALDLTRVLAGPPPRLGEHTVRVLDHDLGMPPADGSRLGRDPVVEVARSLSGSTARR
jgi:hypothetical protein